MGTSIFCFRFEKFSVASSLIIADTEQTDDKKQTMSTNSHGYQSQ